MTEYKAHYHIRDLQTNEIVHSVGVSNLHFAERVLRGMLMRINTNRYYVDESEVDAVIEALTNDGHND